MARMTVSITEMAENSVRIRTHSENLSSMAEGLNGMVNRFRV
jgi:methyl-accepting chemotaxis protein